MKWKKVFATLEEPQQLSTGKWLGDEFPGAALPSVKALRKWIIIRYGDKWTCAQVMDVGPWCVDDDEYVFGDAKSRAETHKGRYCPLRKGSKQLATVPDGKGGMKGVVKCNGAGIDLFPRVAKQLRIPIGNNVMIEWTFVEVKV